MCFFIAKTWLSRLSGRRRDWTGRFRGPPRGLSAVNGGHCLQMIGGWAAKQLTFGANLEAGSIGRPFLAAVGKASRLTSSIARIPQCLSWPEGKAGRLTYGKNALGWPNETSEVWPGSQRRAARK
jgi:hypothetical protein